MKEELNKNAGETLTKGSLLAKNVIWNLTGQVLPMFVALITIPLLVHGLGTDRFGVLTLVWIVIGYFSIFDFGIGRSLTKIVSEKLSTGSEDEIPATVWSGMLIVLAFGIAGTAAVLAVSPWIVKSVLSVPEVYIDETISSFYLLGLSIPVVISTSCLIGVISSLQRFDILNAIRIPQGIFNFVAPIAVIPFTKSLLAITTVLVIGRVVIWLIHLAICLHLLPSLKSFVMPTLASIRPLFRFGAWMTVSNVIGPFMIYLDRFVIGAALSIATVAYYATPFEVVSKLLVIPAAVVNVLFPAFAATYITNRNKSLTLFTQGCKHIYILIFPVCLLLTAFSEELLTFWLGSDFAVNSTVVLQLLAIGVFINCLAQVGFYFIQGIGHPDITAKLHIIELPLYFLVLWYALKEHGINGAAFAWGGRALVDMLALFLISKKYLPDSSKVFRQLFIVFSLSLTALIILLIPDQLETRSIIAVTFISAFIFLAWRVFLSTDERRMIASIIRNPAIALRSTRAK